MMLKSKSLVALTMVATLAMAPVGMAFSKQVIKRM